MGRNQDEAEFFLVDGRETGCNSLRPPAVRESTKVLRVPVVTLDRYLRQKRVEHVDFIKMDVEGAELEVLKGAVELLQRPPRPVMLCEVEDIRTRAWGYKAREIVLFLKRFEYLWFKPLPDGRLEPVFTNQEEFNGNYLAIPKEVLKQIHALLEVQDTLCLLSE